MTDRSKVWVNMTGLAIPISKLKDDHLLNIERYLLGRGHFKRPDDIPYDEWRESYDAIRAEIDRRGLPLHPEDAADRVSDSERLEGITDSDEAMAMAVEWSMNNYGAVGPHGRRFLSRRGGWNLFKLRRRSRESS